ncbi:hypothetical protein [Streptomyces zagrosensis]|uniref:Uncharacterized protein n=1 Tax=Streptomyces zagrosensis TaxID=1042984 RepID=A0A7W9Q782_9ACTN|nr:hypothetical protein [Streptomyces zagrosensis]MBB5933802.1 hypothetical protein [Streptomyces zagrosensis]
MTTRPQRVIRVIHAPRPDYGASVMQTVRRGSGGADSLVAVVAGVAVVQAVLLAPVPKVRVLQPHGSRSPMGAWH